MPARQILALSSSRVGESAYLETAVGVIRNFLGATPLKVAFIPFASVDSFDDYHAKVKEGLEDLPYHILLVRPDNAKKILDDCDAIMVGGGNTFKLLHVIYLSNLKQLIQEKVQAGTPYIGWSAGANITGKTIGTTNDMPIIEPESFAALNFFPFQINPHYINEIREDHNGETRDQRLEEFIKINPGIPVIGIPEGTALIEKKGTLKFIGKQPGIVIMNDANTNVFFRKQVTDTEDLSHLLQR